MAQRAHERRERAEAADSGSTWTPSFHRTPMSKIRTPDLEASDPLAEAHLRAAQGAAFLDERSPGWHNHIDPSALQMSIGARFYDEASTKRRCVLCQLSAQYPEIVNNASLEGITESYSEMEKAWLDNNQLISTAYGFLIQQISDPVTFTHLDTAWIEEITRRQRADA
ncbi:MAG: hypothetical protein AAGF99_00340 [Bacteroidota bacterium]